jgi:hypothetical protein
MKESKEISTSGKIEGYHTLAYQRFHLTIVHKQLSRDYLGVAVYPVSFLQVV